MQSEKSDFLHLVRWLAATFVVIGHSWLIARYPSTSPTFTFLASHAHAAVIVFFVLSGYVIAATTAKKAAVGYSLRDYFLDRFSRIYSVVLPALLLTIALDTVGRLLFTAYDAGLPQSDWLLRLLVNLFSLQGMWGLRIQFASNPPLWSIGYEVCYYALFGLLVWRPRFWQAWVGLIALVMGPKILAYGLIWLMGVAVFRTGLRVPRPIGVSALLLAGYFFEFSPVAWPQYVRDFLFGLAVALFIGSPFAIPRFLRSFNRQMADFSYSLYAYHFPIMYFASFFVSLSSVTSAIGLAVFSVIAARLLYEITEKRRGLLRHHTDRFLRYWVQKRSGKADSADVVAQREADPKSR